MFDGCVIRFLVSYQHECLIVAQTTGVDTPLCTCWLPRVHSFAKTLWRSSVIPVSQICLMRFRQKLGTNTCNRRHWLSTIFVPISESFLYRSYIENGKHRIYDSYIGTILVFSIRTLIFPSVQSLSEIENVHYHQCNVSWAKDHHVVWLSLGNQDLKFYLSTKNTGCPSPTDLWWTACVVSCSKISSCPEDNWSVVGTCLQLWGICPGCPDDQLKKPCLCVSGHSETTLVWFYLGRWSHAC
jgi:hypothetical protein